MKEVINYIFWNMQQTENCLKATYGILKNQARFNRSVKTLGIILTVCMISVNVQCQKCQYKIDKIINELEVLKSEKETK